MLLWCEGVGRPPVMSMGVPFCIPPGKDCMGREGVGRPVTRFPGVPSKGLAESAGVWDAFEVGDTAGESDMGC